VKLYALDGRVFDPVVVGRTEADCLRDNLPDMCCGCNAYVGREHEPGCDWERCPRCGGQFISCPCDPYLKPTYSAADALDVIAKLAVALAQNGWE